MEGAVGRANLSPDPGSVGKQVQRFVPQAIGVLRVDCVRCDASEIVRPLRHAFGLVALLEIAAANALQERRRGQEHQGRSLVGRRELG